MEARKKNKKKNEKGVDADPPSRYLPNPSRWRAEKKAKAKAQNAEQRRKDQQVRNGKTLFENWIVRYKKRERATVFGSRRKTWSMSPWLSKKQKQVCYLSILKFLKNTNR